MEVEDEIRIPYGKPSGEQLRAVGNRINRISEERLTVDDLEMIQLATLYGAKQQDIATATGVARTTITRLLVANEKQAWMPAPEQIVDLLDAKDRQLEVVRALLIDQQAQLVNINTAHEQLDLQSTGDFHFSRPLPLSVFRQNFRAIWPAK
jgi:predicted DNA-binding protein (UPF0251 family)